MSTFSYPGLPSSNTMPGMGYSQPNNGYSYGSTIASYNNASTYVPPVPTVPVPGTNPLAISTMGDAAKPPVIPEWQGMGNMMKGTFLNANGGLNLKNVGSLAETIGAFGQLWSGIQQNKIAKESLGLQKEAYRTNLEGQRASYNMALEDRITSRYAQTGGSSADAASYISKYKLGS